MCSISVVSTPRSSRIRELDTPTTSGANAWDTAPPGVQRRSGCAPIERVSDGLDPWSSDVPAEPPPVEFVFGDVVPDREISDDAAVDNPNLRRWQPWQLGGAAVALGGLLLLSAILPSARGALDSSKTDGVVDPVSPLIDAVELADVVSEQAPQTTGASSADEGRDQQPQRIWVTRQVELPTRLRELASPTTLNAITARGLVYEIDLATGVSSSIDLDERLQEFRIYPGHESILIASRGGPSLGPTVLTPGKPPVGIDSGVSGGDLFIDDIDVGDDVWLGS